MDCVDFKNLRRFLMSRIIAFLVGPALAVFTSCATVPKEAPREFHDAKASLDKADSDKVKQTLPVTIEAAESHFNSALSSWSEANKKPGSLERTADLREATKNAGIVNQVTNDAIRLNSQIKDWDRSAKNADGTYASAPDLLDRMKTMQNRVAGVTPKAPEVAKVPEAAPRPNASSPFARGKSLKFQKSVAYFDTDKASLDPYFKADVKEITGILELDPNLIVTVSGYADPRGSAAYNYRLSEARAKSVEKALNEAGIDNNRMRIAAMGSQSAHFKRGASKLQLERRVDTIITVRQAAETSAR
jgi:OmpA-OmpF porin, OOP family